MPDYQKVQFQKGTTHKPIGDSLSCYFFHYLNYAVGTGKEENDTIKSTLLFSLNKMCGLSSLLSINKPKILCLPRCYNILFFSSFWRGEGNFCYTLTHLLYKQPQKFIKIYRLKMLSLRTMCSKALFCSWSNLRVLSGYLLQCTTGKARLEDGITSSTCGRLHCFGEKWLFSGFMQNMYMVTCHGCGNY